MGRHPLMFTSASLSMPPVRVEQGTLAILTNHRGYEQLLDWAQGIGVPPRAGVEGLAARALELTRFLEGRGITVIEVNRPDRSR